MSGTRTGGPSGTGHLARDETGSLISSEKVAGTSVYDKDGNNLGTIDSVMLTKREGRVAYAVLSFGGFLGLGTSYCPVPWSQLTYSEDSDGYVTSLRQDQLTNAPRYETAEEASRNDPSWKGAVDTYWGEYPTSVGHLGS